MAALSVLIPYIPPPEDTEVHLPLHPGLLHSGRVGGAADRVPVELSPYDS